MAKKFVLPLILAVLGLTVPLARTPFTLLVVDEQTGGGVPSLRVTDGDGMVRYTGTHGELIIWSNRSGPRFEIQDETDKFDATSAIIPVIPDGETRVKVHRRTYR